MGFAQLPKGAVFHNQSLWGSIGWATPASFGAALAAPDRRLILVTGEGSQLTAQEVASNAEPSATQRSMKHKSRIRCTVGERPRTQEGGTETIWNTLAGGTKNTRRNRKSSNV